MAKVVAAKHQIFSFDYRGHGHSTMAARNDDAPRSEHKDSEQKASEIKKSQIKSSALRIQQTEPDEEYKMSKDNLVGDIVAVIRLKYGTEDPPPIVLVGHSLGGALAVHCAQKKGAEGIPSLVGIV